MFRRLSTSNDLARRRAARDKHVVDQSATRDADSAYRDRPTELATPSIASQASAQCTSPTDRQQRNPHSV